jgi:hypothetical protein
VAVQPAPLHADRTFHTATPLDTGEVLIVGGAGSGGPVAEAERFQGTSRFFAPSGNLATPRLKHTATLLGNGEVLVAGGQSAAAGAIASAEIWDPGANAFVPAPGALAFARRSHTATRIDGKNVVVAGGEDATGAALGAVERFVAGTGFQPMMPLVDARTRHTATLLDDGEVLIAGGFDAANQPIATVEIYDTRANGGAGGTRRARGSLNVARAEHAAIRLADGRVLIVGGVDGNGAALRSAEVYDPRNERSANVIDGMIAARAAPRLVLLIDGNPLVTGSGATAEIFDVFNSKFVGAGGTLANGRANHTATRLRFGDVLIFGGAAASAPAEIFVY